MLLWKLDVRVFLEGALLFGSLAVAQPTPPGSLEPEAAAGAPTRAAQPGSPTGLAGGVASPGAPGAATGLPFAVVFTPPALAGVKGDALPAEERAEALELLEEFCRYYPEGFLERYVREVVVLDDLVVDGIRARGHRDHRQVMLELHGPGHRLDKRDFDHEVFHALDGYLRQAEVPPGLAAARARAVRLRDLWDDYRITPSHRYTFSWDHIETRLPWMAYVPVVGLFWVVPRAAAGGRPPDGFAYAYGRVAPREDRAAVAEALMSGDEHFLARAARDRELGDKVVIVKEMYRAGSEGEIDADYWGDTVGAPGYVPGLAELERRLWPTPPPSRARRAALDASAGSDSGDDAEGDTATGSDAEELAAAPDSEASGRAAVHPGIDESEAGDRGAVPPRSRPPVVAVREGAARGSAPLPPGRASGVPAAPGAAGIPAPVGPVVPGRPRETSPAPPAAAAVVKPGGPVKPGNPVTAPVAPRAGTLAAVHAEALAAFRRGDYDRACDRWREMLDGVDPDYATVQIAINCVLDNALANQRLLEGKGSFFLLSTPYQGRSCWLSLSGLYRTRADAALALEGAPPAIRAQRPRVVSVRELGGRGPVGPSLSRR